MVRVEDHISVPRSDAANNLNWALIAHAKADQVHNRIPQGWILDEEILANQANDITHVPDTCGLLSKREIIITSSEAKELADQLAAKVYTSYEVTLAFCKRAAIAHQLTGCLSEIFFDKALEAAKGIDEQYVQTGKPLGPLHGLPVSLKDHHRVEGTAAAIGYASLAFQETKAGHESEMTKIMRHLGAVLYCKTSVPVGMMSGETYNHITGYTPNPFNRSLSSGGSSGGEGALLAMRGSPLGVGSDIGGSLRIPASFCGLYTLKPSFGRFPAYGGVESFPGQEALRNVNGPMSHSLAAIEMWSKAVIDTEPWREADPDCLPIPWREVKLPQKLCFGFVRDDGVLRPSPSVSRALKLVIEALEAAGHTVVQVDLPGRYNINLYKGDLYLRQGAKVIRENLEVAGEPWPRGYDHLELISAPDEPPARVSDLWQACMIRTRFAHQVGKLWSATKDITGTGREIDALITPCTAWPACKRYEFGHDDYLSVWSQLDYCATVIPVTKVDQQLDAVQDIVTLNEVEASVWQDYRVEDYANAPVAVQLVARRLHEEHLLAVTKVCDEALRKVA
ncbi:putative Acetamidase [Kockovaella imperatae]|uniref:amidase n=1 Tax=Kockovaella imperatae TaxID=4999 RepID=A0A1Y1UDZ8_9TREE|nr:putative Acetamidase [Kockovaella imperatae]ORX36242.1 putative Acetamidase [Kockovaella imperatae]